MAGCIVRKSALETGPDDVTSLTQPQVLEFSIRNMKSPYKTLLPQWNGTPVLPSTVTVLFS